MKKNTKITKIIEFDNDDSTDSFLATTLHDYILEKDYTLDDYIGYDENENTQNFDFIYSSYEVDILKKIESYIAEFEKDYEMIEDIITGKVNNDEISDSNTFFDEFKKILKIKKNYENYNQNLPEKNKSAKLKI